MSKTALITGITGQDGAYLAKLLLSKGYAVHGLVRRSSLPNTERIASLGDLALHDGDMTDAASLLQVVQTVRPDEVYNLAAQSHVQVSFETPEYTSNVNGLGTLRLLEAIRVCGQEKTTRFYQASTSELFGAVRETPQSETTPFYPRSPYGISKSFAYWSVVNYREAYGLFGCNGILFNHESPLRGETFITRKVTRAAARIVRGEQEKLFVGNLEAKRDWGHAADFVEGMWLMLQQPDPDDYVLATGETHTVRELIELAFEELGITIVWSGEGATTQGRDQKSGRVLVEIDPRFYRPAEVDLLLGNPTKAEKKLGWKAKTTFRDLIREMVQAEMGSKGFLADDSN